MTGKEKLPHSARFAIGSKFCTSPEGFKARLMWVVADPVVSSVKVSSCLT